MTISVRMLPVKGLAEWLKEENLEAVVEEGFIRGEPRFNARVRWMEGDEGQDIMGFGPDPAEALNALALAMSGQHLVIRRPETLGRPIHYEPQRFVYRHCSANLEGSP